MNEILENMSMDELEAQCKRIEEMNNEEARKESELWKRFEWETSPAGQLEEYKEECKAYIEDFKSVNNKEIYEEKIDNLFDVSIELYKKGERMRKETIIEEILSDAYREDEDIIHDFDIDEIINGYFEELIHWRDKVWYEFDAEDLVEIYEED